ncbi:hypothetical protein [Sulfurimonas sp.]|uniref:hypothetical protein n=1 Tax=Sulfurimonas sp. TaxID=2022749 RepID=UPI003569D537
MKKIIASSVLATILLVGCNDMPRYEGSYICNGKVPFSITIKENKINDSLPILNVKTTKFENDKGIGYIDTLTVKDTDSNRNIIVRVDSASDKPVKLIWNQNSADFAVCTPVKND